MYRSDYTEGVGEQGASREGQLTPQRTVQLLYQEKRKGLRLLLRKGTEGRDRGLRWQTNRGQDAFTSGRSAGKAEPRGKLRARLARGARRRLPRGGWGSGPRRHQGLRGASAGRGRGSRAEPRAGRAPPPGRGPAPRSAPGPRRGRAGPWRSGAALASRGREAPGRAGGEGRPRGARRGTGRDGAAARGAAGGVGGGRLPPPLPSRLCLSSAPCPERGRRDRRGAAPPRRGRWSAAAAGTCARPGVSGAGGAAGAASGPGGAAGPARPGGGLLPSAGPPPARPQRGALPLAACCQVVGALLAALLLVCGSVSYGSTGGYTGVASLGGIHYYQYGGAYSGFGGADGEKARQLDQRFHLLKLPIARAAMAVGGSLTVFSCLLILFGVLRVPWHFPAWLLLECTLDAVVGIGLVPALYYFFHHLLEVYNSSVCKEREQLYQSKGYQGFRCSLHGAEIAAGLLGCTAVMAYLLSAGLAVKGYRTVRKLKQKPVQVYEL